MYRPKLRTIQFLYAVAIVAVCLSFPFAAFWAIHVVTFFLFLGNTIAILWLLGDGGQPFPRPVRVATTIAQYTGALTLVCWIVSAGWKLQYDHPVKGTVVLYEHAIGILHAKQSTRAGWSIARSQSNVVRLHPSGGWYGSGNTGEARQARTSKDMHCI